MDIVIIGSGNVATVLARKFRAAGHHILQIFSRNPSAASTIAYEVDSESTNYKSLINKNAHVYIVAVSDDAIGNVTEELRLPGKVVAHTAAAVPMDVLKHVSDHHGVFYPLQSFRREMVDLPDTPVFFEGSDAKAKKVLEELAQSIAPDHVIESNGDTRLKLHVAAVVVSNFVNHLYTLAEAYCRKEKLNFRELLPLIEETASRLKDMSPSEAQTGPAIRHDSETIHKHLELLKNHPQLKNLYVLLTESIQQNK